MKHEGRRKFAMETSFGVDHKKIIKILKRLAESLTSGQKTSELMEALRKTMEAHFSKEETVLFPILNKHFESKLKEAGADLKPVGGPVNVMRLEHTALRTIIKNLEQALERDDRESSQRTFRRLSSLLKSHIFREENVLYVIADAKLGEREKAEIARRTSKG